MTNDNEMAAFLGATIGTAWRETHPEATFEQIGDAYRHIMEDNPSFKLETVIARYFRAFVLHTLHKRCAWCGTSLNVHLIPERIYACSECASSYPALHQELYKRISLVPGGREEAKMKKLSTQDVQHIIQLDYAHHKGEKPRATTLHDIDRCQFFDRFNNNFDGWFVTAMFQTIPHERWLVVFLDDCEEDWWIEKICIL